MHRQCVRRTYLAVTVINIMRRTLIIIAIVTLITGTGAGLYLYLRQSQPVVTTSTPPTLPQAGDASTDQQQGGGDTPTPTNDTTTGNVGRFVQVSKGPVVPGFALTSRGGSASSSAATLLSYIERQSGNVFTYDVHTGAITRTSNRTVPGIQSAVWSRDASRAIVRYLSGDTFTTINTYVLPADGSNGLFLAQNLSDATIASSTILTLASGVNGSLASVSNIDGTKPTTVLSTALTSLRIGFLGRSYMAFTKPSGTLAGYAYSTDPAGHLVRLAGPLNGLSALGSPLGKWVLVSSVSGETLTLSLVNTATRETITLPIGTLADKCAWSSDDTTVYCAVPVTVPTNHTYPDDWYQGAVSFSDRIWKIDVTGRYAQLVLDLTKENKGSFDLTALSLDNGQTSLAFMNKVDASLWSFQL